MTEKVTCIRHTSTIEEAGIIVAWLEERGIEASVADPGSTGAVAFGITDPAGIQICVTDLETAERAQALLEEQDRERATQVAPGSDAPIPVKCEDCDREARFPADSRGRVQVCPHCGAHVDVPSGNEAAESAGA